MEEEIAVMHKRGVWHLADLPANVTPVGCRWVYTTKRDEFGRIARHKARLVAQGFKQVKGESYDETFSPVVNFGVIRFFFSLLVSCCGWLHTQCDVTSAYLYAPLKENVYMLQPPGFVQSDNKFQYCKLDRALYGLHQSGREWYYEIHKVLINIGFKKLSSCNCVYIFKTGIILLLYVDDIIIYGKTQKLIDKVLKLLKSEFDIKELGRTRKLLGVEFEDTPSGVVIHQSTYVKEILERFSKFKIPHSSLPIAKGVIFSKSQCPEFDSDIEQMSHLPYRSILGCLSFLSNRTRPDIAYAVNILSQFQSNPGVAHWDGLLRLLGYVRSTAHYKLKLNCKSDNLTIYSDADFAANRDDRTSIGGQIVMLDKAPIDWRTFKEKCVSLSVMESEFVAMTEAVKNVVWFDRIRSECGREGVIPVSVRTPVMRADNQSAINFIKSPVENYRTKHIDVKLFFIRDWLNDGKFQISFVRSKLNLADIFTKPLTKAKVFKFVKSVFI